MPNSLICICIPTYNVEGTIKETLQSILNQTYSNIQVYISDNASTDKTLEVVGLFDDSRLKVYAYDKNVGGEGNFNRCIQLAQGEYTAIFHADDVYEQDIIEKQVSFFKKHDNIGAVFTEAKVIDEAGEVKGKLCLPRSITRADHVYDFETIFKAVLQYSNFLICPSVMVRTEVYKNEIKRWNGQDFKTSADLDVWLRILQVYKVGVLPEQLVRYRIGEQQYSTQLRARTEQADLFLVLEPHLAQGNVKEILSNNDWKHYRWLKRTDRIVRAVNFYLSSNEKMANKLSHDILSFDALNAAFHGRRGAITFIVGLLVRVLIFLRLGLIGKPMLIWMKRRAKK